MKVAIVHDQLQEFGGAERVLVIISRMFPKASIYTSFYSPKKLGIHAAEFKNKKIITSWASKIPFLNRLYSPLRFITPKIWEHFIFSNYDLVISSSGSYMCKGIITKPPTKHISYIHHPPRYLYGYETAVEWKKYLLIRVYGNILNLFLRQWDFTSSQRPTLFIANSEETQRRVTKFYRRKSEVIYPPVTIPLKNSVEISTFPSKKRYITVSRLARAKHIDLLVQTANKYHFDLTVVGTGRDMERLKKIAGPTVHMRGEITDDELAKVYQSAYAFLFASVDEEFGIAPIEAMGYGLPVIAFNSGGIPETVHHNINGYLYDSQTPEALYASIQKLESLSSDNYQKMRNEARTQAEQFSEKNFVDKLEKTISRITRT